MRFTILWGDGQFTATLQINRELEATTPMPSSTSPGLNSAEERLRCGCVPRSPAGTGRCIDPGLRRDFDAGEEMLTEVWV